MTAETDTAAFVDALGIPPEARVDARVPKKLLVEQGAPTTADKRAIQDGIDELQWFAACKPTTIGVPAFKDDVREYLEIAVVGCVFRPGAKARRLIELIHRAIPYPVLLITSDETGIAVSVGHKRHAQNEADKVVIDRVISVGALRPDRLDESERAFMGSLTLARQPRHDLFRLYEGWLARIEALSAARLAGAFSVSDDETAIERRRDAIDEYERLQRACLQLRSQAARAKQISQRVDLNQKIKTIERAMDEAKTAMLGGNA
ncbi:DUF4391 domain-containing protein [Mesorhizobium sp. M1328]|uniref:DUF4391 domain-containing protein n=1 Tax=Mesorhizobium sp. M1328 TaxID=2957082 RepID=UPI00333564A5